MKWACTRSALLTPASDAYCFYDRVTNKFSSATSGRRQVACPRSPRTVLFRRLSAARPPTIRSLYAVRSVAFDATSSHWRLRAFTRDCTARQSLSFVSVRRSRGSFFLRTNATPIGTICILLHAIFFFFFFASNPFLETSRVLNFFFPFVQRVHVKFSSRCRTKNVGTHNTCKREEESDSVDRNALPTGVRSVSRVVDIPTFENTGIP